MARIVCWTVFFLGCWQAALLAQCPLTVDAGTDQSVCTPGGQLSLNGAISGNYESFFWSPATGLSNPNILQPVATVFQQQTYTLIAQALDVGNNLVVNGDFSAGDVGFSSDYVNSPGTIYLPGTYALVTSPDLIYSNFPPCDDHSPGQGNLMVVNGATTSNQDIWCQTVSVDPNTDYLFSAWVGTIVPFSLANLQFFVNGAPLGVPFTASSSICSWEEFTAIWSSGNATTAEICIQDLNTADLGNDFGLDDISFTPFCQVSDSVTVDVVNLQANAPFFAILPCNENSLMLDGSGSSSGPFISYQWTTSNGNILSGENTATATVDAPGSYTLTVTYDDGQLLCSASTVVTVISDPAAPTAVAGSLGQLTCEANSTVILSSAGSSFGADIGYLWETADGIIVGNPNQAEVEATAAGTYILYVTNNLHNCVDTASVVVHAPPGAPEAMAQDSMNVSCYQPTVELDASGSSTGADLTYSWTTTDGHILQGTDSIYALVDTAGTYTFIVLDTITGCADSVSVSVLSNQNTPIAQITGDTLLTCLADSLLLTGLDSTGNVHMLPSWTTGSGNFLSSPDSFLVWIDAPGLYTLSLQDTLSGCSDTAFTWVAVDTLAPVFSLLPVSELNCVDTLLTVGADTSGQRPLAFSWTTVEGQIISADTLTSIKVNAAGWYYLSVQDSLNACVSLDSVVVPIDTLAPQVDAGPDGLLDCQQTSVVLEGTLPGGMQDISFYWENPEGIFPGDTSVLQPQVSAGGTYFLEATDTLNGCSALDSVIVTQTGATPLLSILQPDTLTCAQEIIWITATGDAGGNPLIYSWSTSDGNMIGAADSSSVQVDAPGLYTIQLTDLTTNCSAQESVFLMQDTLVGGLELNASGSITCQQDQVTLTVVPDSLWSGTLFLWSTSNGQLIGPQDAEEAIAATAGIYVAEATHISNGCTVQASIELAADTIYPVIEAGADTVLTCSANTVWLHGETTGLQPNWHVQWSGPQGAILTAPDSLSIEVAESGSYFFTVLNTDNGCQSADSLLISLDTLAPVLSIDPPAMLTCVQSTVSLSAMASGPASFQWTSPDGQIIGPSDMNVIVAGAPAWYLVEGSNPDNGCSSADSVWVQQNTVAPSIELEVADTLNCLQTSVTLTALVSNGGGAPQYAWSTATGELLGPADNVQATALEAGVYVLQVTNPDNGCLQTASIEVFADYEWPLVEAGMTDTLTCLEQTLMLDGNFSIAGSSAGLAWSGGTILGGANSLQPEVSEPGWYFLQVTDLDNGCVAIDSVWITENVDPPFLQIADPSRLNCTQSEVMLDATDSDSGSDFSISWTTMDGQFVGGQTTVSPTVGLPGDYQLMITNLQNGCSDSMSVTVEIDTLAPQIDLLSELDLECHEVTGEITALIDQAGPAWEAFWDVVTGSVSNANTTDTEAVATLSPGQYHLEVTNLENGCSANTSVQVNETFLPPLIAEVIPPNCPGETGSLDLSPYTGGTPPYVYSIDGGNSFGPDPLFEELVPGWYELMLEDAAGCSTDTLIFMEEPLDWQVFILPSEEVPAGEPITPQIQLGLPESMLDSVSWMPADGLSCVHCLEPGVMPLEDATYTLQLWDVNGCADTAVWQIRVVRQEDLFIPNIFTPDHDGINDFFQLFGSSGTYRQVHRLQVFSRWGELVFSKEQFPLSVETEGWNGRFKGQPMPSGVYTFVAELELWNGAKRLISGSFTLIR